MRYLKQSTAVTSMIGPFLDKTDGVTEETGLAGVGTEISKAGAAFGAGPVLGTHDSDGWYPISLTTTHTNTIGDLVLKVHDAATHLPVWETYHVLAANVYDSLIGAATVKLQIDAVQWLTGTIPAVNTTGVPKVDLILGAGATIPSGAIPNAVAGATGGIFIAGTNAATTVTTSLTTTFTGNLTGSVASVTGNVGGNVVGSVASVTGNVDGNVTGSVGSVAADGITASSIATDAIGALELAAGAASEIATAVRTELTTELARIDVATSTRASQTSVDTIDDFLDTEIADIKAKTDNLPTDPADASDIAASFTTVNTKLDTIDDFLDTEIAAILAAVDTEVASILAAVDTEVAAIKAKTDQLTFTTANQVDATAVTVSDKTGYALSSAGLDSVSTTAPAGVAANFREMLVQTWRRFFKKTTLDSATLMTYADNGSTVLTTQVVSDTGTVQTQGPSS